MPTTNTAPVEVNVPTSMSTRQRDELAAFARYCAARVDRDHGASDHWNVSLAANPDGFVCVVKVQRHGTEVTARWGTVDPSRAIWNAMCRIEQPLREAILGCAA